MKMVFVAVPPPGIAEPSEVFGKFWDRYFGLRELQGVYRMPPEDLKRFGNASEWQNIGILHLGGILSKRGHVVDIAVSDKGSDDDFISYVLSVSEDADYVGFSFHTCGAPLAGKIANQVKKECPEITTIAGGPHATGIGTEHLDPNIDVYVRGRAHESLPWLIETRHEPGVRIINEKNVPEGYYKGDAPELFLRPDNSHVKVDKLPAARVYTALGCGKAKPCIFCGSIVDHRRYVEGDLDTVFGNIDELVNHFGTRYLYIGDENFFRNPGRAEDIVRMLEERYKGGLVFDFQANVENIWEHRGLLEKIADTGMCTEVQVGAESADQRVLDIAEKGMRAELIGEVGGMVKGLGMRYYANWLSWLPGEDEESHRYTTDAILGLISDGKMDYAECYTVIPAPGSGMYKERERFGVDIVDWDFGKWRGENLPVFRYRGGPTRERMYELYLERIEFLADLYGAMLPPDFEGNLGIDGKRVLSMF